jgi:DNA-directed RNA polymerase subunit RPC12/RpoP
VMAIYLLSNCWRSFQQAKMLRKVEQLPRRPEFACPACQTAPPRGNYWLCPQCQQAFDPFATSSVCPHCSAVLGLTTCPDCGDSRDQRTWDVTIRDA